MTEKQGGSDVRANTTRRRAGRGGDGGVRAHRPQVVLLGADERRLPDARPGRRRACRASSCPAGSPTAPATRIRIQRLKDKLGDRSNASSEIELVGTWARLVGEEGRGIRRSSRWSTTPGSTACSASTADHAPGRRAGDPPRRAPRGLRRAARRQAAHGATCSPTSPSSPRPPRSARSGWPGCSTPPTAQADEHEPRFAALATPIVKYWTCKRAPRPRRPRRSSASAARATSRSPTCPGCSGRVPLNGIWEGSGNVICLDVLRAMGREPGVGRGAASTSWLARRARPPPRRRAASDLQQELADLDDLEARARRSSSGWRWSSRARCWCATRRGGGRRLLRHPPRAGDGGRAVGTLPRGVDTARIVDRARIR